MLNKDETLKTLERLQAYPKILGKIREMLDLIEVQKVESADDFEEALIPQVRKFGKEIVETWASQEESTLRTHLENQKVPHHSKKNSTGVRPLEK